MFIGQLTFRSTDDIEELSSEQAACVNEIAEMLFLKDNLRIKSASYAIVPFVDLDRPATGVEHLVNVQAVIAYCYASPHPVFGDLFLSSEHASMAIFTPSRVPLLLVRPDSHVNLIESPPDLLADNRGEVEGYAGLYNFRHSFWAAKGSRLYGPKPNLILNHSQDLSLDIGRVAARTDYHLLTELLRKPLTQTSTRIFTALRWFNAANDGANDDTAAIVNLSIAFEALLNLPADKKTNRFTDAISLLLGRIARVDVWAQQFYEVRSRIVHEGHSRQLRFIATDSRKMKKGPLYQPLLSYGRQVFQLCLGTLLAGAELTEKAGLEKKLVTNEERFQRICRILGNRTIEVRERFNQITPIVAAVEEYRFVSESGLQLETMIGATRLAAKSLLEIEEAIPQDLKEHLRRLIDSKRTEDHLPELDALHALNTVLTDKPVPIEIGWGECFRELVKVVWSYAGMYYFWLKQRIQDRTKGADG